MPVEFQGAAYRMGHSMVRPSYRANFNGDVGGNPNTSAPQFFGMIFDPAGEGQADPVDLRGTGTRAPRRFIGWQKFFDFEPNVAPANKIVRPKKRSTRISPRCSSICRPRRSRASPRTSPPRFRSATCCGR